VKIIVRKLFFENTAKPGKIIIGSYKKSLNNRDIYISIIKQNPSAFI